MKLKLPFILAFASNMAYSLPTSEHQVDAETDAQGGFHIHPHLPDGNYHITMHQNGTTNAVKRWEPITKRWQGLAKREGSGRFTFTYDENEDKIESLSYDSWANRKVPLPVSKIGCKSFRNYGMLKSDLMADDYWASKQSFYNWCDLYKYNEGHVELALHGNVAVWVCKRSLTGGGNNVCSKMEFEAAEAQFNQTCGQGPAWLYMAPWQKEYGRGWKGDLACRTYGEIPQVAHESGLGFGDISSGQ